MSKGHRDIMNHRKERQDLMNKCWTRSHFDKDEIEKLLVKFKQILPKGRKSLESIAFTEFLQYTFGMTDHILMERIFRAFDANNDAAVDELEWVLGLSTCLRGDLSERCDFVFTVYDLNGDGFISRDEVFLLLKQCLQTGKHTLQDEDPEDGCKELVDLVFKLLTKNNEQKIAVAEFKEAVFDDTLLLECIGECLPDQKKRREFENSVFGTCQV